MNGRHEYKHELNYTDYFLLRNRLKTILPRDENGDENGEYIVRSLYFDTPGDKALREKIDGVDKREKFRIRRYIGTDDLLRMEKKSKLRGLCYKQSSQITEKQLKDLSKGDLKWMRTSENSLILELYSKMTGQILQPKTIVEYVREAYTYKPGNVRITLDRNIRTGLFSKDFLSDELPMINAGDHLFLLEVKYDAFIPDFIVKLLQLGNRSVTACSKYTLCRIYG